MQKKKNNFYEYVSFMECYLLISILYNAIVHKKKNSIQIKIFFNSFPLFFFCLFFFINLSIINHKLACLWRRAVAKIFGFNRTVSFLFFFFNHFLCGKLWHNYGMTFFFLLLTENLISRILMFQKVHKPGVCPDHNLNTYSSVLGGALGFSTTDEEDDSDGNDDKGDDNDSAMKEERTCRVSCRDDADCYGKKKCCGICGNRCIDPVGE